MADKTNSLYGQIKDIIFQETIYLRHYIGQVISQNDEDNAGCVQVAVPELGWSSADVAPLCYPRQRHSMSIPEAGEWVEVYFINGDMNRPVYLGNCGEMKKDDGKYCIPEWYTGDQKMRVLYQSPTSGNGIKLDDTTGEMNIEAEKKVTIKASDIVLDSETIMMIDGSTEPFVLGTKLSTWISTFVTTIFNVHTHSYVNIAVPSTSGVPVPVGVSPTDILSTVIKGS